MTCFRTNLDKNTDKKISNPRPKHKTYLQKLMIIRLVVLHIRKKNRYENFNENEMTSSIAYKHTRIEFFTMTVSGVVSVSCFGFRVSVMFHFMFVHYTFSSVWVAEWPPFGK